MYNPKSLLADEFIDHQEILDTLAYADQNKNNIELIESILEKARPRKEGNNTYCAGLTHREASVLLACEDETMIQKMYDLAEEIKKAFYGNQNLTTLTIGANVTTIEQYAFAKCPKLKKITIKSKKLSVMEKRAFYKIKSTAYMYAYKSKLTTYQNLLKKSGVSTKVVLRAI